MTDLFGGETTYPPEDFEPDEWEDAYQMEMAMILDRWNEVSYA